ncbi:hypothetical protein [Sphingorhabdus sp. Alg231-15]|uniref:hypothetical protein n=1 Tax=Sphingorhabdus sp. Alg231-15 TaxID=1922222 RepID=UPI000D54C239
MSKIPQTIRDLSALWRFIGFRISGAGHNLTISDKPAFDPEFEKLFTTEIAKANFYLEFGSGASTVLAARAGVQTVSVESDSKFAEAVRTVLGAQAPVKIVVCDIGITEEWGYPVFTRPTAKRLEIWRNYTKIPFTHIAKSTSFPDMVLIDGRFRVACALATALNAQKMGGITAIYIDDYRDREHYHVVEDYLGAPIMIGRAARFSIGEGKPKKPISESTVRQYTADFR